MTDDDIAALVRLTFTASEGAEEGALVGDLAAGLLATTPADDLRVFTDMKDGVRDGMPVAVAIFTRLRFAEDPRRVFLLSPMAVHPDRQRQGVGQRLIRRALAALRAEGVEVAMTYGSPDYYGRVGFAPVDAQDAAPPHPLSLPHGWIGQSLTKAPLSALQGASRCAPALDDPRYW